MVNLLEKEEKRRKERKKPLTRHDRMNAWGQLEEPQSLHSRGKENGKHQPFFGQ